MGKSQTEYRREAFEAQAEVCRTLGDEALFAIDAILAEQDRQYYEYQELVEQNGIDVV